MLRVGHGGAGALARANTLASFEAALELGVDMIEFDVRAHARRLVLAHSPLDPRRRRCLTLDEALRHLNSSRFADLRFNVDVKQAGCEAATLYALERHGLTDRALISARIPRVLDRFRALDPSVRTGISIAPRIARGRHAVLDWRPRALRALADGRFRAVMAQHRLIDSHLVDEVRERAGELFAWTVDERATIARMRTLGVTGVVSNDPRLFHPLVAATA